MVGCNSYCGGSWPEGVLRKLKVCLGVCGLGELNPSVQLDRCQPEPLWGGFEVDGRKHPWGLELWPFHYLQFLSPALLYFLVSTGLGQMLRFDAFQLRAGGFKFIRHQPGLVMGH